MAGDWIGYTVQETHSEQEETCPLENTSCAQICSASLLLLIVVAPAEF